MKITIDSVANKIIHEDNDTIIETNLYSKEGFELLSNLWKKVAWNEKYTYTFTWQGRPIIQLPQDMFRIQEIIYSLKPDVIVETGIAHGGSLIYYASLCELMGKGKVIGIDIELRPANRKAIEAHKLSSYISLIEGSSTDPEIINQISNLINDGEKVLVILDSNHSKQHVLQELESYKHLISKNSYLIATDGIMQELYDVPRGKIDWKDDNPLEAIKEFLTANSNFICEEPKWLFNESHLSNNITHWPMAYIKRIK